MTGPYTTAKMFERVRALIAKAESTEFPEEAETFRAKADELMTRYAIDSVMIDQAAAGRNVTQTVERRDFATAQGKFWWELESMFHSLAFHCRCVVGSRGITSAGKPVFGLPSDMDYLDMLFTTLQLEVAKNLQPSVNPNGEVGEEVFNQRQAGIGWKEITRKMYTAGLVELTKGERAKLDEAMKGWRSDGETFDASYRPTWEEIKRGEKTEYGRMWSQELGQVTKSIKNRLANANRRYVNDNGLDMERNYVSPEVYQRSFIIGFQKEIRTRLIAMRDATRSAYDAEHKGNEFALAVRDVRAMAMDLYEQTYPAPPPVPIDPNAPKRRKGRAPVYREVKVDYGAMGAGRRTAKAVNLSNKPGDRLGGRKDLPNA